MDVFPESNLHSSEEKTCIFCCKYLNSWRKSKGFDENERNRVLKLVSASSEKGFCAFFWNLVSGEQCFESGAAGTEGDEQKVHAYQHRNDDLPYLPVCSSCLDAVVKIDKLHSDLERIQLLLADGIGKIQRNVLEARNSTSSKTREIGKKYKEFQEKVCIQSRKSTVVPLVILERLHGSKLPAFDVNLVKQEPRDCENFFHVTVEDNDHNWSPACSNTDNNEDFEYTPTPIKRGRGRPRKSESTPFNLAVVNDKHNRSLNAGKADNEDLYTPTSTRRRGRPRKSENGHFQSIADTNVQNWSPTCLDAENDDNDDVGGGPSTKSENTIPQPSAEDDDHNWSPSCSDADSGDEEYIPTKRGVSRSRKEATMKRSRPRIETSVKRTVGRPRKVATDPNDVGEHSTKSPPKRSKPKATATNDATASTSEKRPTTNYSGASKLVKKMNHRLFIRKNPWKPSIIKPADRKMHFHTVHTCEICNKTYYKELSFLKHKQAHEDEDAAFEANAEERTKTELQKLIKSKMNHRLFIRKTPWKPLQPDQRKKHFHAFYRCEICNKTYFKRIAYLKHKRAHEEVDAMINEAEVPLDPLVIIPPELKTCSICQQQIHPSDYSEHLLGHEEEVGRNLQSNDGSSGDKPFVCTHKDCLRRFNIEENLKIHIEVDHDEINSAKNLLRVKKCDVCNICYNTSNDLLTHFKKVHKEQARNLYYCPVCQHCYSRSENLIIHMHSHPNKDQQICFICKSNSPNRQELLLHFEQVHGLDTKGECGLCEEKFEDVYLCNAHMKSVHKRKDTFVCSFCGKICYFHSSFMRHVMMHTKIERRDLWCDICNEPFSNKNNLYHHRVTFHGVAKIQCSLCSREYLTPYSLSLHMKTHNKQSAHCEICDKYFAQKIQLVNHQRSVHSQERPFACEFCGSTFKTEMTLKRHLETHEKRFECSDCGRKFSRFYALKNHRRMHTGETIVCHYCGYEFHNKKSLRRHVVTYHESDNPLPLYKPQKTRVPCSRWKDDDGNTCHAKNVQHQTVSAEPAVAEEDSVEQLPSLANIGYRQEHVPSASGSMHPFRLWE